MTVFCLSTISNGGSPKEYCLFLWISGLGKDKAAIHRISEQNGELPYVTEFIITGYSLGMTATAEKKGMKPPD